MSRDQQKTQKGQHLPNLTEDQAREHVERLRWPNGPACPHCESANVYRMKGESIRDGLLACRDCKGHFTVTVGTVMEDSHLPLSVWVRAFHLMASSKKGISALQLQRNLGLGSYRTAWHLAHRVREAMRCEPAANMLKGQVQADETWIGGKMEVGSGEDRKSQFENKTTVMVLVETNGRAHSRPIEAVTAKNLRDALEECVELSAQVVTDEHVAYPLAAANFSGGHQTVNHSRDEYARKRISDDGNNVEIITTNTAESYFALLKRGVHGTFHHVSKRHLHRYCNEFDFRWCGRTMSDTERRDLGIAGAEGKRLFLYPPVGEA
jgi:transposase-like protein